MPIGGFTPTNIKDGTSPPEHEQCEVSTPSSGLQGDPATSSSDTVKEGSSRKRKLPATDPERVSVTENAANEKNIHECHICNKRFSNHQALGGHMTSHTKGKMIIAVKDGETEGSRRKKTVPKVHRCKVCGKEFETGQKLGGHMRAHYDLTSAASSSKTVKSNADANSVSGTVRNKAPSDSSFPGCIDDTALRLTLGPSASFKSTAPYSSSSQSSEGASLSAAENTDIRLTLGPSECIKSTAPYPSSSQSSEGASLHVAEDIDLRLTLGPSESSKSTAPNLSLSQSSEGARNEVDRSEQAEEEQTESRVFELYASVKMSL